VHHRNLDSERDISTFAQTNSRLYNFLVPYLYCHNALRSQSSALLWAAKHGQEVTGQRSLGERANVQATDKEGRTPLLLATENGHEAVVKLLLDKGAHLARDPIKALHYFIQKPVKSSPFAFSRYSPCIIP
jgi:ankyrin repeat protein